MTPLSKDERDMPNISLEYIDKNGNDRVPNALISIALSLGRIATALEKHVAYFPGVSHLNPLYVFNLEEAKENYEEGEEDEQ